MRSQNDIFLEFITNIIGTNNNLKKNVHPIPIKLTIAQNMCGWDIHRGGKLITYLLAICYKLGEYCVA